jgi:AraC-like DNA-binding protein
VDGHNPVWAGTVVLGDGVLVYVGPGAHAGRHSHDAIQLVMTMGRPFVVELDAPCSATSALVSSRTPHAIRSTEDPLALVLVEPRGRRGQALRDVADRVGGCNDVRALLADLKRPPPQPEDAPARILGWADDALAALMGEDGSSRDSRVSPIVRDVLDLVEGALPGIVRLTGVASAVAMSPSALTHVFTREVGMPFRRFVLWARLRRAAVLVQNGADLTTAAATSGFADGAHLSRTFRSLFGLSPSEVLSGVTIVSRFDRIVQATAAPHGVS